MAWTTPKTDWETGALIAASDMNEVGENLATLKNPATAVYTTTEEITVLHAPEFADVDGDNLNLSITTAGGDVLVHLHGTGRRRSGDTDCDFDIDVDGNRQGGDKGILSTRLYSYYHDLSFTHLIQNLSAGNHTFKLQYKTQRDGIRLLGGAQFWVREI